MPKSTTRSPKQRAHWAKLPPWMKHQLKKAPLAVWARRIRKEFNYKCSRCPKKTNLEAHHIYPKHLHSKQIEDLDNGLLVCLKCHDEIHALLVKDPQQYYQEVMKLNSKREPMKSVPKKRRNPSGASYKLYDEKVPEGAVNDPPEPKPIALKAKKPQKKAKVL